MAREIRKVRVGEADLACRVAGDGFPLLMVMGHTGTLEQWPATVVDALARDHRVIVYDHRGMGDSSSPPGEWSVERFAADAAGLLEALGIGSADVLGWSMGGLVAQELALSHPGRVRRLVLCATSPGGAEAATPAPGVLAALHDDTVVGAARARRVLEMLIPGAWLRDHPSFANGLPRPSRVASTAEASRQWRAMEAWRGSWDRLPTLGRPVLVMTGDEDVVSPPENGLRLVQRIPGSWLVRFAGGGHGFLYQFPGRFVRVVRTFLEE